MSTRQPFDWHRMNRRTGLTPLSWVTIGIFVAVAMLVLLPTRAANVAAVACLVIAYLGWIWASIDYWRAGGTRFVSTVILGGVVYPAAIAAALVGLALLISRL